jgi:hypothetical protein
LSDNTTSPEIPSLKHTVFFGRKVSDGNYGSEEASFFLQFETPPGASMEWIQAEAMTAYVAAKSAVLEQLGISYDLDAEQGTIVETGRRATAAIPAPQRDAVTQVREAFGGGNVVDLNAPQATTAGDDDEYDAAYVKSLQGDAQQRWLKARLQSHPFEFHNNIEKKADGRYSAKAPDYKHKTLDLPIWPARKAS